MLLVAEAWRRLNAETIGSDRYWWIALQNAALYADTEPLVAQYAQGRTLDLGAGRLAWRELLRRHSTSYVSGDLFREHPEVDVLFDATKGIPFAEGTFDTVFSCSVLEHTRQPWQVFQEMGRVLKPGGVAIVSVPFTFYLHGQPDDYYRFTRYGLAHLAVQADFEVVEMRANGGLIHLLLNVPSIAVSALLATFRLGLLIPPATRLGLALARTLGGWLEPKDLFAMEYVAVLRKRKV